MKPQSKEIIWNIVNSLLAGFLVLLGSFTNGLSWNGFIAALVAATIVACTQFKKYWEMEEADFKNKRGKLFSFI